MHAFLPFILIGLATGAVYGLAGIGLVLTYKTSGIFNLGYGAIAAFIAFSFYYLNVDHGWPWPWAAAVSLLVVAPILGLGLELQARSLESASETVKVVSTVGLILIVQAIGSLWHPTNPPTFPHFLPQETISLLGVNITWEQVILFVLCTVAAAVLYWFFKYARLGIVMRGVVDNQDLVAMSGDSPVVVRRVAWIIGSVFAGVAGLMLAPTQELDGPTLTTVVFAAFGAAAIGYFTNLPLTFAGGLIVGIAGALVNKYSASQGWIAGLSPALPFIVLFIVLIVLPRRLLIQRRLVAAVRVHRPYQAPARIRVIAGVVAITVLALIPAIQASHVTIWSAALINIILFLSLGLLVRQSGQISLCCLAFAAVGAAAFGHFAGLDHIPWLPALVLSSLIAIPVGAIIAIPAIRISGTFLALATLGFGILMEQAFYTRNFMFQLSQIGLATPRPHFSIGGLDLSSDSGFFYLLLLVTVLVVAFMTLIDRARLGRLLAALADSPLALETNGASPRVLKVIVFCITAALAALAGAFEAMLFSFGVGTYFPAFNSLILVAIVVIVTAGAPWYAVIAAVGYSVLPAYISGNTTTSVLTLFFGVGAATAAFGTTHGGMPASMRRLLDRLGGRKPLSLASASVQGPATSAPRRPVRELAADGVTDLPHSGLAVRGLSVRFGGVIAVNDVSLNGPMAKITGLIGPNGAGKTTTFNACTGLTRANAGQVLLHDHDVTRAGTPHRARLGLGRTFQRPTLFEHLTVRENVAMGREASMAGANPFSQLLGSRRDSTLISSAVDEALELTDTGRVAELQVGLLSIGQRRLVELARTLAGPFDVLLLDEPSSGLDGNETEQFGRVLQTVVRERGCAVLLVEHDMALVRSICDYLYVLDFGQLIFEGTTAEMERSAKVKDAYLGRAVDVAATSPVVRNSASS